MAIKIVTFTSDDTWIVPSGVTSLKVEGWSRGGIGYFNGTGGGGGGGAYGRVNALDVAEGDVITISAGGTVYCDKNLKSFFLIVASGADANVNSGGVGGQATDCLGDVCFSGGNGADGVGGVGGGGGGGAGSTEAGTNAIGSSGGLGGSIDGGNGGTAGGSNALPFGGGGASGGARAVGKVVITYDDRSSYFPLPMRY